MCHLCASGCPGQWNNLNCGNLRSYSHDSHGSAGVSERDVIYRHLGLVFFEDCQFEESYV